MISIHALREEGDAYEPFHLREKIEISIHALREEGDQEQLLAEINRRRFLSTPSARRATSAANTPAATSAFLSTPSARRATTTILTALRHLEKFLSTPSARRATLSKGLYDVASDISIHALREEGDTLGAIGFAWFLNFYPRPPRGGRLISALLIYSSLVFLSTPSARRATQEPVSAEQDVQFLSTPSARRATYLSGHYRG